MKNYGVRGVTIPPTSDIPHEVAMRALEFATRSGISMTVFLDFYEQGRKDADLVQGGDE